MTGHRVTGFLDSLVDFFLKQGVLPVNIILADAFFVLRIDVNLLVFAFGEVVVAADVFNGQGL